MSSKSDIKRQKSLPKTTPKPKFQKDISVPGSNSNSPRRDASPTKDPDTTRSSNGGSSTRTSAAPTPSSLYVINEGHNHVNNDDHYIEIPDDCNEGYNSRMSVETLDDVELPSSLKFNRNSGSVKKVRFTLNGEAW